MSYKTIIKLVISALFLVYILIKVDLRLLYLALLSVKMDFYLISFLVLILNSIVLALKYKIVMEPSGISQSLANLIKINFVCRFYSMFLTTAIGQSVVRWHISTKNQEGRPKFISVMIFERSSFMFALFSVVMISTLFLKSPMVSEIAEITLPFLSVGLLCILIYYICLNHSPSYRIVDRFGAYIKGVFKSKTIGRVFEWISTSSIYYKKMKITLFGIGLAFLWHLFFVLRVYLLTTSVDVPLSFLQLGWMASLVLLLQILPVTFSGIGIRETAYAYFFGIQNLAPEKGVLLGMLLLSQILIISTIGGVLHVISKE